MSTDTVILADKNDAALQQALKRKPSGKKVYKPHMATRVKWALEDCMERTEQAQIRMRRVLERLDEIHKLQNLDVRVEAHLGRLDHELFGLSLEVAELERIVTRAVAESRPAK